MEYAKPEALVSTQWLAEHLGGSALGVVDATFFVPTVKRDAAAEFRQRHIPGAVFFDIDDICDHATGLPHMLPDAETFARRVGGLGLGDGTRIVVYDANGGFSAAARVWWSFRVFGHREVAVLDGGLPRWLKEGRPVEKGEAKPRPAGFTPRRNRALVRGIAALFANLESRREQVVDARSARRFAGLDPEPRPTKKAGHIPGSVNLPYGDLIDPANEFVMRPAAELTARFAKTGVDLRRPVVASCGSGVTAAVVSFAAYLLGFEEVAVYDGSWAEWGNRDDTPVES